MQEVKWAMNQHRMILHSSTVVTIQITITIKITQMSVWPTIFARPISEQAKLALSCACEIPDVYLATPLAGFPLLSPTKPQRQY